MNEVFSQLENPVYMHLGQANRVIRQSLHIDLLRKEFALFGSVGAHLSDLTFDVDCLQVGLQMALTIFWGDNFQDIHQTFHNVINVFYAARICHHINRGRCMDFKNTWEC